LSPVGSVARGHDEYAPFMWHRSGMPLPRGALTCTEAAGRAVTSRSVVELLDTVRVSVLIMPS
jgi:hypothetical protein